MNIEKKSKCTEWHTLYVWLGNALKEFTPILLTKQTDENRRRL